MVIMMKVMRTILMLLVAVQANAEEISIPENIQVPEDGKLALKVDARGYQVYECVIRDEKHHWQLKAPDAVLYDQNGQGVGSHSAGPTWKFNDGSLVTGMLLEKADASGGKSIPWLLVKITGHKGQGVLSTINYINRANTQGGLQPEKGCNENHPGRIEKVAYRASYYFYQ